MIKCMHFTRVARAVLVAGALTLLVAVAPAAAERPLPRPNERAAAREFAFAAYRLRVAVLAHRDEIQAAASKVRGALQDPRCNRAVTEAPESRRVQVVLVSTLIVVGPVYDPIRPELDLFLAELERVRTADPVLRSGRAGWRSEIDLVQRLPSVADPCAVLQAWQRTGFAASAAPLNIGAILNPGLDAADGKLARAERRMRQLGVSAGAAKRFTGDTLFRGVANGLDLT
jgi:hypothetical protein